MAKKLRNRLRDVWETDLIPSTVTFKKVVFIHVCYVLKKNSPDSFGLWRGRGRTVVVWRRKSRLSRINPGIPEVIFTNRFACTRRRWFKPCFFPPFVKNTSQPLWRKRIGLSRSADATNAVEESVAVKRAKLTY